VSLYLQQLFNGVVLGSEYAMLAVGLVLVFSVLRVLNFAHGAIFAWGGLAAVFGFRFIGINVIAVGLVSGVIVGTVIAAVVQFGVLDILNRKENGGGHLAPVVATVGVSWMLVGLGSVATGPNPLTFPVGALTTKLHGLGPIHVSVIQVAIIATALGGLFVLDAIVFRTRLGRQLRAVAYHPANAELLGVDVARIRTTTFVISGALAGLAGALSTLSIDLASPYISEDILGKGFAIIIIGGMGSVRGAIVGSLLLGIAEVMSVTIGLSAYTDAVAGVLLFVVLMVRPAGLFGRSEVLRA
jgi:branched-chain amino acid transport system permease protein